MSLGVKLLSGDGRLPVKANASDAGYDLFSAKAYEVGPWSWVKVDTDIAIAVPFGTYGRVAPRSGLAAKYGIHINAGVVDYGYRGPVGVILCNMSDNPFVIQKGDRIAQLVLEKIDNNATVVQVDNFQQTDRGAAGFGSSGLGGFGLSSGLATPGDTKLCTTPALSNAAAGLATIGHTKLCTTPALSIAAPIGASLSSVTIAPNTHDGKLDTHPAETLSAATAACTTAVGVRGGKVVAVVGCMMASKTTHVIAIARRYILARKKCLIVKYAKDTRYSNGRELVTHDGIKIPASWEVDQLSHIPWDAISAVDVLIIDEGQFYSGLMEFCHALANHGKIVIVSGLVSTADQKPFEEMCRLVAVADQIIHLTAVCSRCGDDAAFSKFIGPTTTPSATTTTTTTTNINTTKSSINIGGTDKYTARCRACFPLA
jgi:dUTP pyrophosphatase